MINYKLKLVADFETTTRNDTECVWLWDVCRISDLNHVANGTKIEEFIDYVNDINIGCDIYFHNLKFDVSFIINYLLKNGCRLNQNDNIKKLKKGEMSTLITDMGQFFKVSIKNKKGKFIHFIDSLKVIPFSAERIALDFELGIAKGSIDYNKYRPDGYMPTTKEIEYCQTDTAIIAKAMKIMLDEGHNKLTLSSNAYYDYQKMTSKADWDRWFGKWESNCDLELDCEIREAYRGGFCYANSKYVNKTIKQPTYYYDVNSLYPSIMMNYALPYGMPIEFIGQYEHDDEYPLYIQEIEVNMEVKENGIPCILNKQLQKGNNKYIVDTSQQSFGGGLIRLTVTKYDLDLIYLNYDIYELHFLRGWKFKERKDMFTNYVDKYFKMKVDADKTGNKVKRTIAKLFLNSLYGKFGQNPKRAKKYPKIVDGVIKLKYDVECDESEPIYTISKKFHYLPVAVFITSIARYTIINDIHNVGVDNWLYSDTDSIITLVPLPSHRLSQTKLGLYKKEHTMMRFKTLGQKTYYGVDINGKKVIAIAGCNKKALKTLPFGKFEYYQKGSSRQQGVIRNGRSCLTSCVGGKKVTFSDFCLRDKRDFIQRRATWNDVKCILDDALLTKTQKIKIFINKIKQFILQKLTKIWFKELRQRNKQNDEI